MAEFEYTTHAVTATNVYDTASLLSIVRRMAAKNGLQQK